MGGDPSADPRRCRGPPPLTAFLDTNVVVRHLTGDPPAMAARATAVLAEPGPLRLVDVVVAECAYVLGSFYKLDRPRIAELLRATIALPSVSVADAGVLLRTLVVYEMHRLAFADAYLVAWAESTGVGQIVSFDRAIDRVGSVVRREP